MALDFPSSPTNGQTVVGPDGTVWTWDGVKWVSGTAGSVTYAPLNSPVFTGDPQAPTAAPGDNDTSLATTAFVHSAVAPALNDVGRNLIHNPLFNIAQRGAGPFSGTNYTLDRWALFTGLDSSNVSQAPFGVGGIASDEAAVFALASTVAGNAGAASYTVVCQLIEDVRRLAGKTVTISFLAYVTAGAAKVGVGLRQAFGTGGSPSGVVDISATPVSLTTTPTRYAVTMTLPSIAGKTIGTNNDSYTRLGLFLSSGSDNNALAGGIGVQSANFVFWGIQLEIGSVATPLEMPDPQQDLAKCQRFYWVGRIYTYTYLPIVALLATSWPFPTQMRAAPTLAITSNGSTNLNAGTILFAPLTGGIFAQGTSVAAGATSIDLTFTASADL